MPVKAAFFNGTFFLVNAAFFNACGVEKCSVDQKKRKKGTIEKCGLNKGIIEKCTIETSILARLSRTPPRSGQKGGP